MHIERQKVDNFEKRKNSNLNMKNIFTISNFNLHVKFSVINTFNLSSSDSYSGYVHIRHNSSSKKKSVKEFGENLITHSLLTICIRQVEPET